MANNKSLKNILGFLVNAIVHNKQNVSSEAHLGTERISIEEGKSQIEILVGDITRVKADAIVCPTNERLWADAGLGSVIFQAAGFEELTRECEKIGTCETGSAVITPGFRLSKYIIHAVGPMWEGGDKNELVVLANSYRRIFELAMENGIHSLVTPLIASGIHGVPKEDVWTVALTEAKDFLLGNRDYGLSIQFITRDEENANIGRSLYGRIVGDLWECEDLGIDYLGIIRAGIFGVVVGDALGVPVEFTSRLERKNDPVTDMRAYGTHSQPKGTWSDDSSMMLATLDSLIKCNGVDYDDMMQRFEKWQQQGEYTPYGNVFDIGITCSKAISNYRPGCDPLKCGGDRENDNGNGSLMRIMAASLYAVMKYDLWRNNQSEAVNFISNVSALTHRHIRSQMGCVLYTAICYELVYHRKQSLEEVIQQAVNAVTDYYEGYAETQIKDEFGRYSRLAEVTLFKNLPEDQIKSSGYVVHTLEAAVWCLLNSTSFSDCVLKAVNLGDDTDTVGAVTGGLAGLWYGFDGIPREWIDSIALRDWIDGLSNDFSMMFCQ